MDAHVFVLVWFLFVRLFETGSFIDTELIEPQRPTCVCLPRAENYKHVLPHAGSRA